MKIKFTFLAVLLAIATGCGGIIAGGGNMSGVFSEMESAMRNADEARFREQWLPAGYSRNLVGSSGLSGERLFSQGSRKKWYPKPDLGSVESVGKVEIVFAELYNWEQDRKVDEVYFVIAKEGDGLKIVGGGEDEKQVRGLAERFNRGESLGPAQ